MFGWKTLVLNATWRTEDRYPYHTHNITEQAFHTTDKQTNKHMITQDDICTNKKFTLGGLKG